MVDDNNQKSQLLTYLINFLVLGVTYYESCSLFVIQGYENLMLQSLVYAIVVVAFMRLGRLVVTALPLASGRIQYTVLVNATGIMTGALSLLAIGFIVPNVDFSIVAIVISSVIAFFILGTLSPLLLFDRRMSAR